MKPFVIFGWHAVTAALTHHPEAVVELFVGEKRGNEDGPSLDALAQRAGIRPQRTKEDRLTALAGSPDHQGVVARRRAPEPVALDTVLADGKAPPLMLVLDQVQDPHNLGAALRVADAAGVGAIIVPSRRSAHLTGSVYKVASGAAETVPVIEVSNLAHGLEALKEAAVWLTGLAGEAEGDLYAGDYRGATAFVLGNEGAGLRRLTRDSCDFLVRIPMVGTVESLNVSTASAICLFEARRQRGNA